MKDLIPMCLAQQHSRGILRFRETSIACSFCDAPIWACDEPTHNNKTAYTDAPYCLACLAEHTIVHLCSHCADPAKYLYATTRYHSFGLCNDCNKTLEQFTTNHET